MPSGKGNSTRELDTIALGLAILSTKPTKEPRTLEEIADYCQCSKERIRQIEQKALRKLRKRLSKEETAALKDFLINDSDRLSVIAAKRYSAE